jgi:hypothetical protein
MTSGAANADKVDLVQIPTRAIVEVFPTIKGWLEGLAERSGGRWSVSGLLQKFVAGDWQLWMVWDGKPRAIVGTELYLEMTGMKCCMIRFCTGSGAPEWQHLLGNIEDWARLEGCSYLDMLARKGWAKHLPEYKLTHVELERDLR